MKRLLIFIAIALTLFASCNNNTKHPATPLKWCRTRTKNFCRNCLSAQ